MTYIGIDVGGTFTDLCIYDDTTQSFRIVKTPTTPQDLSIGVRKGLSEVDAGDRPGTRLIHHGTTLVTNSYIERRGVKTGLITTEGFRDVLELMRADRERLYDLSWRRPEPFVPRELRREVTERVGPTGDVLIPLDEDSVREAARFLAGEGCDSIAVALLHSHTNPEHERRVAELVEEVAPGVHVFLSSRVDPQYREYERTSTTVLTAFVGPLVERYFGDLARGIAEDGFPAERLSIMQSNGGTMKPQHARERAGFLFSSGPAAGVVGAVTAAKLSGYDRVITIDMGGTSADVSIAKDGRFSLKTEHHVEFQIPLRAPSIDVVSIGAGGGSIARVDAGGALRVGPESAGARPGPACYGHGGTEPTITDANLVLGRLPAGEIGGGTVVMSADLAVDAVTEHVAEPLGLSPEQAALGIVQIANAKMANAIREVSVARGEDPRDFALVAFGGAGALHAVEVAEELDIPTVLVPAASGVLSAVGCMMSDVRFDQMRSVLSLLGEDTLAAIDELVGEMRSEIAASLEEEGFEPERQAFLLSADMRYVGQVHEVNVDIPDEARGSAAAIADLFHDAHARLYGAPFPGHDIEVVNVRLAGVGKVEGPELRRVAANGHGDAPQPASRPVVFPGGEFTAGVFQREELEPGHRIEGPAVIESQESTTLITPNRFAVIDEYGSIVIKEADAS
jgi:N-methylhydantoinase A